MLSLDELDRRILVAVQDSKIKDYRGLAEIVDAKKSTVYNRVQTLRENGILKKQFGQLNLTKLDFSGIAMIGLNIDTNLIEEVIKKLSEYDEIYFMGRTIGNYDLTMLVISPTINILGEFIDKKLKILEGIDKKHITISIIHKVERFAEKIHIPE